MKHVHVECIPDEVLVKQLGFTKHQITHHHAKSRVIKKLRKVKNELAMVDEDPGTNKTTYEKSLKFLKEQNGIKQYVDDSGNLIAVLNGKLEDWILWVCKGSKIDISDFGLPANESELHEKIHLRLNSFKKLINHLVETNNQPIQSLKSFLTQ